MGTVVQRFFPPIYYRVSVLGGQCVCIIVCLRGAATGHAVSVVLLFGGSASAGRSGGAVQWYLAAN
jgi:hypothetical protein